MEMNLLEGPDQGNSMFYENGKSHTKGKKEQEKPSARHDRNLLPQEPFSS